MRRGFSPERIGRLGAACAGLAVACLAAALPAALPARAAGPACGGGEREIVWAERVVGGDEILLVDGRTLRLAGVEVPPAPLAADADARRAARTIAGAAHAALADRVEGRELGFERLGIDRHGRALGHLYDTETGQWIEAAMVAAGRLRVVPSPADRACAAALVAEEAKARRVGAGLWASSVFRPVSADRDALSARVGDYVVVEARVRSVGRSGARTWLNFGEDFRRDFAAVLRDKDVGSFAAAGIDPAALRGRVVRLRGVVFLRNGPRIAVEVPEDLEVVGQ